MLRCWKAHQRREHHHFAGRAWEAALRGNARAFPSPKTYGWWLCPKKVKDAGSRVGKPPEHGRNLGPSFDGHNNFL
jgi:hypothetical protein